ncbi:MAG: NTP transferase domain-containing protein [Alphaproteobacteria bacterium]|nr:NTP transferase domain-containing protein [Alphaproteobacteria bacterium]
MKSSEVSIGKALGMRLLNSLRLDTGILPKGHVITEEDVLMFQIMGLKRIAVVEVKTGDVELKTAQGMIAAKLSGDNVSYVLSDEGVVKIVAAVDGFFISDEKRIEKFNVFQNYIILNTTPCYCFVKKGEVIAKIDFVLPVYASEELDALIVNLSGNSALLSVQEIEAKKVGVIYVDFYDDKEEKKHFTKTLSKLIKETKKMELEFAKEYHAAYDEKSIANAIVNVMKDGCDVAFILSSVRAVGNEDILPVAVESLFDNVAVKYIDVVEASDFLVATKKDFKLLSLPKNYANVSSAFLNEMLVKAIVKEKLLPQDFYVRNNFLENSSEKLTEVESKKLIHVSGRDESGEGDVAVVVLAAGASLRAKQDKLMKDYQGKPLFYHAVMEAVKSKAGLVFLVTGGKNEEMTAAIGELDVNIVHNLSHREGVKSSIRLGLNHLPSFCKGAILLPADMPNITATHLNKMIKKFDKTQEKQVVVTMFEQNKFNPILWSRDLFAYADVVPENSDVRPVLVEFEDVSVAAKVKTIDDVFDVTYPADLAKLD